MSKGFASNLRMTLLATGVLACFLCVGARLVYLHVIDRDELLKYVDRARRQIVVSSRSASMGFARPPPNCGSLASWPARVFNV